MNGWRTLIIKKKELLDNDTDNEAKAMKVERTNIQWGSEIFDLTSKSENNAL